MPISSQDFTITYDHLNLWQLCIPTIKAIEREPIYKVVKKDLRFFFCSPCYHVTLPYWTFITETTRKVLYYLSGTPQWNGIEPLVYVYYWIHYYQFPILFQIFEIWHRYVYYLVGWLHFFRIVGSFSLEWERVLSRGHKDPLLVWKSLGNLIENKPICLIPDRHQKFGVLSISFTI